MKTQQLSKYVARKARRMLASAETHGVTQAWTRWVMALEWSVLKGTGLIVKARRAWKQT
jgi:hypothetical protein